LEVDDMHELSIPGSLDIRVRRNGVAVVLELDGELDMAYAPQLEYELIEAESSTARLIVDLSGLGFMDSAGLQTLLRAERRCRDNGCRLSLVRGSHQVQRVFELTSTEKLFSFEA
jgi:anti-anti-sigma factor